MGNEPRTTSRPDGQPARDESHVIRVDHWRFTDPAARQVDDAMVERAWRLLDDTCPAEGPTLLVVDRHDVRAALLAALNAPEPASEKPPRNSQHLEATGQLAALREAAQAVYALWGEPYERGLQSCRGREAFAALRAALNPQPEGER